MHTSTDFLLEAKLFLIVLSFLSLSLLVLWSKRQAQTRLYGDAHWANLLEIKKMGFLSADGLIIGRYHGKLLTTQPKSHALVFAPSRSGKGVSQVIPNALAWQGSLVVTDLKLEVFEATSGFRAQCGQRVFLFAPSRENHQTHCYNPLDSISRDNLGQQVAQVQLIAQLLIPSPLAHDMWTQEARALACGLLLWLLHDKEQPTLGDLADCLKGNQSFVDFLTSIIENTSVHSTMNPVALQNINSFLHKAPKEQSGVKSTLGACLSLWDDPYVRAATARSDFALATFRQYPSSLYLGIPAAEQIRLAPLMNLIVQQFSQIMSQSLPSKEEPHHVLVILDEFCNLGHLEIIKQGFSYLAGYHVHFLAIMQNIAQGYELYGQYGFDSFLSNTDYKIFYYQNEPTGRQFLSNLLGTKAMQTNSHSVSYQKGIHRHRSINYQAHSLLTPEEVGRFDKRLGIALVSGYVPIKFKRIIYYKEACFKQRLLPPMEIAALEVAQASWRANGTPLSKQQACALADKYE